MVGRGEVAANPQAAVSFRNVAGNIVLGPITVPLSVKAPELQRQVAAFLKQAPSQVILVTGSKKLSPVDDVASLGCQEELVIDMVVNSPPLREVTPHRFANVYMAHRELGALDGVTMLTRSLAPGNSVLLEDRCVATDGEEVEYRVWDPFHCRLVAAVVGGIGSFPIKPGAVVLFPKVGPQLERTVSHVSDIVGSEGRVLVAGGQAMGSWAAQRPNIAELPASALEEPLPDAERVDVVINGADFPPSDRAQRTLWLKDELASLKLWLKTGGWAIHVVDAQAHGDRAPFQVFHHVVAALRAAGLRPREQITLEPYHSDTAVIVSKFCP
uniref:rRNA 2'-O-methyltransferase fibrillarin n=1 Tax=Alexandrium monilatum TaxID=311494 RepID=A0A6T0UPZ8_9DINO